MSGIQTVEQLDEMRARALAELDRREGDDWTWEDIPKYQREGLVRKSRAIREADARVGLVTVPREPTGDMLNAFSGAIHHWLNEKGEDADVIGAVLAASPLAEPPQ